MSEKEDFRYACGVSQQHVASLLKNVVFIKRLEISSKTLGIIEEVGLLGLDIGVWFEKVTFSENVSLIKIVVLPDVRIFIGM